MADNDMKAAIDQAANALQTALVLATSVRRNAGEHVNEAIQLEASVDRAARALRGLTPERRRTE